MIANPGAADSSVSVVPPQKVEQKPIEKKPNPLIPVAEQKPKEEPELVVKKQEIIDHAKTAVQAGLRDPDSAKFRDVVIYGTGNNRTVCGSVNSKNGFGGYVGYYPFMYEEMTKKVSTGRFEATGGVNGELIDGALRRAIEGLCKLAADKQGNAAQ